MTSKTDLVIYLIHFTAPVNGAQHYLGICKKRRLRARLGEHARGQGARLTSRACFAGVGMYVVKLIPNASFAMEKRLKNAGKFKLHCPLCTKMPRVSRHAAHKTVFHLSAERSLVKNGSFNPLVW